MLASQENVSNTELLCVGLADTMLSLGTEVLAPQPLYHFQTPPFHLLPPDVVETAKLCGSALNLMFKIIRKF